MKRHAFIVQRAWVLVVSRQRNMSVFILRNFFFFYETNSVYTPTTLLRIVVTARLRYDIFHKKTGKYLQFVVQNFSKMVVNDDNLWHLPWKKNAPRRAVGAERWIRSGRKTRMKLCLILFLISTQILSKSSTPNKFNT